MKKNVLFVLLGLIVSGCSASKNNSLSNSSNNNATNNTPSHINNSDEIASTYFKNRGTLYFDNYGKSVYFFSYSQIFGSDEFEYAMYYSESRGFYRMVCGFGASDNSDWGSSYVDFYSWGGFGEGNFNFNFFVNNKEVLRLAYSNVQIQYGKIGDDTPYVVTLNEGISRTDSSAKNGIGLINRGIEFFDHWVVEINLPSYR